ncbi:MAG: hypothetical protein QOJ64_1630 [Acidobacteriota bacterium]|nr:hypothetical protein [Acidobacteriota bacterium]
MLLTFLLIITSAGCTQTRDSTPLSWQPSDNNQQSQSIQERKFIPPKDWNQVKTCSTNFFVPPSIRKKKVQGIDSCVGRYQSANILIELDVAPGSDLNSSREGEYSEERGFNLRKTKIDGWAAEIITFDGTGGPAEARGLNYAAVLYVPQMPEDRGNFTIWALSKSPEARDLVFKIFESVRFAKD